MSKITFDVNALVVSLTPNHRWTAKWVIVKKVLTQNRLGNQPKFFENEDMNGKAFCFISSLVEHQLSRTYSKSDLGVWVQTKEDVKS